MKHAGAGALASLEPLLKRLRNFGVLKEKSPGVFYLRGKAFLHFHEDPAGLFADARLGEDFIRSRIQTAAEQKTFVRTIDRYLTDNVSQK